MANNELCDRIGTITERWPTGFCKDIPKISFDIVCTSSYVYGNYVKVYYIILI